MTAPRIIVALDFEQADQALAFSARLDPSLCRLKVGKQLFTAAGPLLIEKLVHSGFDIFLDLKFHDIPATVAGACKSAANLGVWMLNVHALGGRDMLCAARDALPKNTVTQLIAVTLLTSMDEKDLHDIGLHNTPEQVVGQLAQLTHECKLDGIVCSALETQRIRSLLGHDFTLVTPGIRPADHGADDQQRIATPAQAIKNGASYLVIGRPITQAQDPIARLKQLNAEIAMC